MRKLIGLAVVLIALTRCAGEEGGEAPSNTTTTKDDAASYQLRVDLLGLIAFVEKDGIVWALMPKTEYDPQSPQEADLPPHVLAELTARHSNVEGAGRATLIERALLLDYPTHVAKLRFENATVTQGGSTQQNPEFSLAGKDVEFLDLPALSSASNLDLLADSSDVIATNTLTEEEQDNVRLLNKVDPALITSQGVDSRLAARARVNFGTLEARENSGCPGRKFSFRSPAVTGPGCPGGSPRTLGEEVMVTVDGLQDAFRIRLAAGDEPFSVTPTDRTKPVVVQILYQVEHPQHEGPMDCFTMDDHLQAFRWFYRLTAEQEESPALHFFPCEEQGVQGGNKCPQIELVNGP